ncbi:MAG: hypothetical protein EZS28_009071 [Streblomastix strix]|uniref:TM2 domain-containing protein n=1 Tax=Streblomastix strix TaxID=222440 RepID=A0A5J4WM00_9EUKA|nr:MAG: hypothetical protein EZS28_009071 [Streblomastix strix]
MPNYVKPANTNRTKRITQNVTQIPVQPVVQRVNFETMGVAPVNVQDPGNFINPQWSQYVTETMRDGVPAWGEGQFDPKQAYKMWMLGFVGCFGMHRIYLGERQRGILYCATAGLCMAGQIYDLINLDTVVSQRNSEILKAARQGAIARQNIFLHQVQPIIYETIPDINEKRWRENLEILKEEKKQDHRTKRKSKMHSSNFTSSYDSDDESLEEDSQSSDSEHEICEVEVVEIQKVKEKISNSDPDSKLVNDTISDAILDTILCR